MELTVMIAFWGLAAMVCFIFGASRRTYIECFVGGLLVSLAWATYDAGVIRGLSEIENLCTNKSGEVH
jgi:hypothetical protein